MPKSCPECNGTAKNAGGRAGHLFRLYGISLKVYNELLEKQGGHCALCPATEPGSGRDHFCVDHDHVTGRVRGLLCYRCNLGLGQFKDRPEVLRTAITYLGTPE